MQSKQIVNYFSDHQSDEEHLVANVLAGFEEKLSTNKSWNMVKGGSYLFHSDSNYNIQIPKRTRCPFSGRNFKFLN